MEIILLFRDPRALIHPKIQNFIPFLQRIGSETDARIVKLIEGANYKPRNKKYEAIDNKINENLNNFEVLNFDLK